MKKKILLTIVFFICITVTIWGEKITIWHTESDPLTIAALDRIKVRFQEQNPGVKIEMVVAGWDDLYRKITLAISSGNTPDLTQIQPFMAAYLYKSGQLQPIDDLVNDLDLHDIFPAVRDLQLYDGKRYGIATALGISYYSFRIDLYPPDQHFIPPKTWDEFLRFMEKEKKLDPGMAPLLLPANDLHITLLFTELLASNDGSLFDSNGKPDFQNTRVIATLDYWKKLYNLIPGELQNSPYKENFTHYAQGRSFSLPCFFGRGLQQIERTALEDKRSPDSFAMFPHIIGPSGKKSYATLDAEPWVILKNSPNPSLAKKFLKFFYQEDNYMDFCTSVPIHLTPIFQSLAKGKYRDIDFNKKWSQYYEYLLHMLDTESVLPIFMANPNDRFISELFKLEGSRVVSGMVRDVIFNGYTSHQAAARAMKKANELIGGVPIKSIKSNAGKKWLIIVACIFLAAFIIGYFVRRKKILK
jgi:multiple sugar transport system substrate-binding protein